MSQGRWRERERTWYIAVRIFLRFILFLMNWQEIKDWTRIALYPLISKPQLLAITFYSLDFSQFMLSHLAAKAKSNDGQPKWSSSRQSKKHRIVLAKTQPAGLCADPNSQEPLLQSQHFWATGRRTQPGQSHMSIVSLGINALVVVISWKHMLTMPRA